MHWSAKPENREFESHPLLQFLSLWCNGSTIVSKTICGGSSPSGDAKFNLCVMSVRSDGRPWKSEVAGSNPATQTKQCTYRLMVRTVPFQGANEGFDSP